MSDHKDITDYARLGPPIKIPTSMLGTPYTAAQCREKAAESEANLEGCIDADMCRWFRKEAAGWQRLALDGRK
jgi:hypothetical protein